MAGVNRHSSESDNPLTSGFVLEEWVSSGLHTSHLAPRYAHDGFVHADPPYLTQSTDLYVNTMTYEKHQQLADTLATRFRKWIVSYDCDPRVADELYHHHEILRFGLRHSAGRAHRGAELMAFSPHVNPDSAAHLLHGAAWQRRHHTTTSPLPN